MYIWCANVTYERPEGSFEFRIVRHIKILLFSHKITFKPGNEQKCIYRVLPLSYSIKISKTIYKDRQMPNKYRLLKYRCQISDIEYETFAVNLKLIKAQRMSGFPCAIERRRIRLIRQNELIHVTIG